MADQAVTVSEAEYLAWLTASQTLAFLSNRWTGSDVAKAIVNRARTGMIRAAAELAEVNTNSTHERTSFALVPETFWKLDSGPAISEPFWKTGDIIFAITPRSGAYEIGLGKWVSFTGIRFENAGVEALGRQLGIDVKDPATSPGPKGERRGAKRKDWWDHLWIAMIRRIIEGSLNPKDKAELQRILESYVLHELDGEYGDSTLKPMASNLFKYLQEIRGK